MKICVCNICKEPLTENNTNVIKIVSERKAIDRYTVPNVELCNKCQVEIRVDFDNMINSLISKYSNLHTRTDNSGEVNGCSGEVRKRGRKPKPKEDVVTEPKKRGRKPKVKESSAAEESYKLVNKSPIKIDSADIEDTLKEPVNPISDSDITESAESQESVKGKGKKQTVNNDEFYLIKELHSSGDDEKIISGMLRIAVPKVRECFDFDTFEQYEESHGKKSFDIGKCKALLKAKWTIPDIALECKVSEARVIEVINSMRKSL